MDLEAAQRALEDAKRRRALLAKILPEVSAVDKRPRPSTTSSTKVTPDGKKACTSEKKGEGTEIDLRPRALSFSEAEGNGHASSSESAAALKSSSSMDVEPTMARVKVQATPQNKPQTNTAAAPGDQQITYKPVKAADVKAFFSGIAKAESQEALDVALPPPGLVLPVPPVPQVLPSEVQNSLEEQHADFTTREEALMEELSDLSEEAFEQRVSAAIHHPLFPKFCHECGYVAVDDMAKNFAQAPETSTEEVCGFEMWLEEQGASNAQQAAAWGGTPQIATPHMPAAATTQALQVPEPARAVTPAVPVVSQQAALAPVVAQVALTAPPVSPVAPTVATPVVAQVAQAPTVTTAAKAPVGPVGPTVATAVVTQVAPAPAVTTATTAPVSPVAPTVATAVVAQAAPAPTPTLTTATAAPVGPVAPTVATAAVTQVAPTVTTATAVAPTVPTPVTAPAAAVGPVAHTHQW